MEAEKTVETISTISGLLTKHGSDIVITAIFLAIFILVGLYFIKHQQTISNKIIKEHERLINMLIEERVNCHSPKINNIEITVFEKWQKMNQFIQDHLNQFINDIEFRRIGVYLFHNGQTSLNGFPFIKFSCVSEKCINFYDAKMKEHRDVPVNLMDTFILDMSKGLKYITDDGIGPADGRDQMFLKLLCNPTNNYIIEGIFDNRNLVGFIVVEFDKGQLNNNNLSKDIDITKNIVKAIVPLFPYFNNIKAEDK